MTEGQKAYAKFLKTEFWLAMTAAKKAEVGHCERCQSKRGLQSHHRFYRADWFATELADLEVLCRTCHRKEHGIEWEPIDDSITPEMAFCEFCHIYITQLHSQSAGNPEADPITLPEVLEWAAELPQTPPIQFKLSLVIKWHSFFSDQETTKQLEKERNSPRTRMDA